MLKEMPVFERPRERLVDFGAESLSNVELLAIILRTGTPNASAIDLAKRLIFEYEDFNNLLDATIEELTNLKGIGLAKAITIKATLEIGKRMALASNSRNRKITSPKDAYNYLRSSMENLKHEELVCIFLNVKSEIIKVKRITVGTTNSTLFDPKDVLKWALKYSSSFVIVSHNHPSGDSTPSDNDRLVTEKLIAASKMVDIKIIDHIIIGKNSYFSFLESNSKYK